MTRFGIFASLTAIIASVAIATVTPASADKPEPCQRKEFKTVIARDACAKDQATAKDAMKKFMKDAKIKSCNQCHTKLAPTYELKADGLDQFKKAGGKLIDDK